MTSGDFFVSTGALPPLERMQRLVDSAHARFQPLTDGDIATYIPRLATADPNAFAVAMVSAAGDVVSAGDCDRAFSIQSLSKPFVLALILEALGPDAVRARLGVNATGMAFDSVIAIELGDTRATNPMVNAGAITAASLLPGTTPGAQWAFLARGLSRFAGRPLEVDNAVYRSESETNLRNRGIAALLHSYGKLGTPPDIALDTYTRQCALAVTVTDIAAMAATLANGGTNPLTGEPVVSPQTARQVLAVMAIAGLYQRSGDWLFDIGLPGKSGVSGGILTAAPGKGGLGAWSPPLDAAGNSVRGKAVTRHLSEALGLNLFASVPASPPRGEDQGRRRKGA
jgi:glutaminase